MDRRRCFTSSVKRAAMFLWAIALLGCQSGSDAEAPAASAAASGPSHVFVIVMENKEHGELIGARSAPFTTSLARRYASLSHMYGVRHPSLPNYFALTAGTT